MSNASFVSDYRLIYEGSVKRVFKKPATDSLLFEFTDNYSVFDWGKMPDTIEHKGCALALIGAFFFEKLSNAGFWQELKSHPGLKRLDQQWLGERFENDLYKNILCSTGVRSHFRRLVSSAIDERLDLSAAASEAAAPLLEVAAAAVIRPEPMTECGQTVYYYPPVADTAGGASQRRLIPLEVVFRFGMPSGSSLQARLEKNPGYAGVLGLSNVPCVDEMFAHPVIEFFTKLEPSDRLLSVQEALLISQLPPAKFACMTELARDLSVALYATFAACGIELWDGKFEFVVDGDEILLADSIGPDELRLLYKGKHLSKEMLRQVYRGGAWEKAIKEAKQLAAGGDWKKICKQEPKPLPADIKRCVDSLYPMLANVISGQQLFAGQPDLDQFIASMPELEIKL